MRWDTEMSAKHADQIPRAQPHETRQRPDRDILFGMGVEPLPHARNGPVLPADVANGLRQREVIGNEAFNDREQRRLALQKGAAAFHARKCVSETLREYGVVNQRGLEARWRSEEHTS